MQNYDQSRHGPTAGFSHEGTTAHPEHKVVWLRHQWFRSEPDQADGSTPHHSRQKILTARTCLPPTTRRASPQYHPALCQPLPCPRLEASTWSAKEDLDTTGGRGSHYNRLAVVIGAGSLVVEVATTGALKHESGKRESGQVGTKKQWLTTREWTTWHEDVGVENAGADKSAVKRSSEWVMQENSGF